MGFSGGTDIARTVVSAVKQYVPDVVARRGIYGSLIGALEDADWDTQCEARGIDPVFDELLGSEDE